MLIDREHVGGQSSSDNYHYVEAGVKEKVSITLHLFAFMDNNPRKAVQACLPLVAHVEKTSRGDVGVVVGCFIHTLGIIANPWYHAKRLFF